MRALATALLPLLVAAAAAAQQVPQRLSVEDALRLAEQHNPSLRKADNDVGAAEWGVRQAWAAFLPDLRTSLSFNASRSTGFVGQDDFGRPVQSPIALTTESSSASQGISAGITLFDGGANLRTLSARKSEARAASYGTRAQAVAVQAQVQRAFYQAMRAEQNIALEEQLLASAKDRLERSEALLRLAANDQVDVLGARADVASQQQRLEQVRADAAKARLNLLQVVGVTAEPTFELAGELPEAFDPAALDAGGLVASALERNPGVAQRAAQADAAARRVSALRGNRLPTISMQGSYGRNTSARGYGAVGELDPRNTSGTLGFTVSLPLFNRFGTTVQIAQAAASAEDAALDVRAARQQLETEVRSAHVDLVNAYRSLRLAEESARFSRDRLELAQEKFRLGAVSFTELQNVTDRTAQAERAALDARFAFVVARIALEERLGHRLER